MQSNAGGQAGSTGGQDAPSLWEVCALGPGAGLDFLYHPQVMLHNLPVQGRCCTPQLRIDPTWTARRSNQSILKEISPEYSSEGLMLKLQLQYFGHLMWRTDSLDKSLMLGKTEGRRRRGWQRMRRLDDITDSLDMSLSKFQEMVQYRKFLWAAVHGVTKSPTRLNDWTTKQHTSIFKASLKNIHRKKFKALNFPHYYSVHLKIAQLI